MKIVYGVCFYILLGLATGTFMTVHLRCDGDKHLRARPALLVSLIWPAILIGVLVADQPRCDTPS